jgi:SEC-C motif-containing protein
MQNLTYLLKTWHPRTCPVLTTESLSGTQWHGLEVIRSLAGFKKGWVEFRAHYTDVDGVPHHLHEISEFHKVKNRWVYHSELDDWPDDESESGHR